VLPHAPHTLVTTIVLSTALLAGCWGGGPGRVKPPDIDAGDAGDQAIELYDKDGDGAIAGAELDAVPGVKAAMETIDADKDGKATAEEIAARVESWQATRVGVMSINCSVTLDGRVPAGAIITFEPESFLGDNIKAGVGEVGPGGSALVSIPKDQRPAKDTPPGLQLGLYRVRISLKSNGQETIPSQYNSETTLGQQVSGDDPAVAAQRVTFALTTQ
jgi:hypothetical protein